MKGGFKAGKQQDDWTTTRGRGASSASAREYKVFTLNYDEIVQKSLQQPVGQLRFEFYPVRKTDLSSSTRRILDEFHAHATASVGAFLRLIYNRKNQVSRPPGSTLLTLADFLCSKKTLEEIVAPLIADMQFEYNEALFAGRKYKAMWIRVRVGWSFFKTLGMYSIPRTFVEIWRKVSSV